MSISVCRFYRLVMHMCMQGVSYSFHRVGSVRFGGRLSRNPNLGYLNRRARNSVFERPPRMILVCGEQLNEFSYFRDATVARPWGKRPSSWPFLSSVNRSTDPKWQKFGYSGANRPDGSSSVSRRSAHTMRRRRIALEEVLYFRRIIHLCKTESYSNNSSNPECSFSMMEQVRLCAVWHMKDWLGTHFQNHNQGRMNDLNMLLLCFRMKTSD